MTSTDSEDVARRFNDAINQRDLSALMDLVTDDHRFVDSAGTEVTGRVAVQQAWTSFLEASPDYLNEIETVETRGDLVILRGRSHCPSTPALHGPAIWTARVRGGRLSEWCAYDDEPATRAALDL